MVPTLLSLVTLTGLYFTNLQIFFLLLLCNSVCHPMCIIPDTGVCPSIYRSPAVGFMNMLLIHPLYGHLVCGTFGSQGTLDVESLATVSCCKNMVQYNMILHTALLWLNNITWHCIQHCSDIEDKPEFEDTNLPRKGELLGIHCDYFRKK